MGCAGHAWSIRGLRRCSAITTMVRQCDCSIVVRDSWGGKGRAEGRLTL